MFTTDFDTAAYSDGFSYLAELTVYEQDGHPSLGGDLGYFADPDTAALAGSLAVGQRISELEAKHPWDGQGFSAAPVPGDPVVSEYRVVRYGGQDEPATDENWTHRRAPRIVLDVEVRDRASGVTMRRTVAEVPDHRSVLGTAAEEFGWQLLDAEFVRETLAPTPDEWYGGVGPTNLDGAAVARWIAVADDPSKIAWPAGSIIVGTAVMHIYMED